MVNTRKSVLFYVTIYTLILLLLECIGEGSMRYIDSHTPQNPISYKKIRLLLLNDIQSDYLPMFLPQANLNYINYPGQTQNGIQMNNNHGYRGPESSVIKPPRIMRILFLGGSTTYGLYIPDYKKTYPYLTKILLDSLFKNNTKFHEKYDSIECINAGLLGAISTEELTHYFFKFRYYKPDVVVIKPGLNEAQYELGVFQPDYTHIRNTDFYIKPLPARIRWVMHSRFASFLIINFFYVDYLNYGYILEKDGYKYGKYCNWFPPINVDSLNKISDFRFTPFYQNTNELIKLIQDDSAIAILQTSPLDKKRNFNDAATWQATLSNNTFNNSVIIQIAKKNSCFITEINYCDINEKNWIDDCHVNENGNLQIAQKAAATIKSAIEKTLVPNKPKSLSP